MPDLLSLDSRFSNIVWTALALLGIPILFNLLSIMQRRVAEWRTPNLLEALGKPKDWLPELKLPTTHRSVPAGLRNYASECFRNSVLQVRNLYMSIPLSYANVTRVLRHSPPSVHIFNRLCHITDPYRKSP
jgi:hypothetical protein